MKLEQSFEVQAPIDEVWAALIDLERVAPCLPGAAITERDEDGTYHGTFQVKLGPATAAYRGTIRIEEADEAAHRATLKARGTDKRGQGGASATIVNTLSEHEGGTRVEAVTDFSITGRLAAFGRGGMMEDISNRMMRDFATCLQSRLASDGAAAAPSGAEVTAGDAAPEAVVAAEPEGAPPAAPVDPGPGATTTPPMGGGPHAAPLRTDAPSAAAPGPPPVPPPAAAPPVKGFSLFFGVLWDRIKRRFGRGRKAS
jgi:carbon monoxide dehydrogenase subunit G